MPRDNEIRELFARHNVPLDRDDVWAVQGTPVVKHKALERLGAAIGVVWQEPTVLRSERDEAVLMVVGRIGQTKLEWSIGEAVMGQNYKVSPKVAAYPYAMAEKRGKDRVILKLAGLQGVYSEEEADEFKHQGPSAPEEIYRGGETVTKAEVEHLRHLLQVGGRDEVRFCQKMKIAVLDDLPAHKFDEAVTAIAIATKAAQRQNGAHAHA